MKPVIEVRNIGKKFRIQHESQQYFTLRDSFFSMLKGSKSEELYVLNDVSFNVNPGESLGIIGKNGAGKTTLLKILSKITPPTKGEIICRGRVASLLEVGTGFHGELTGRENLFLNGAILGMKKKEIAAKFDEIVDFSGVEKFIDTPLKRYSTGMQLRLAFSVAAFLEPEVLVIDEILAVGDAEFQKKCLNKMDNVSKSGRTVLFVSHNLGSVSRLCPRSIMLRSGVLTEDGNTDEIISKYIAEEKINSAKVSLTDFKNKHGRGEVMVHSVELLNAFGNMFMLNFDEDITLKIDLEANADLDNIAVEVVISTLENNVVFRTRSQDNAEHHVSFIKKGRSEIICRIKHNLRSARFRLSLGIMAGVNAYYYFYYNPEIAILEIQESGTKKYNAFNSGLIDCESNWEVVQG